MLSGERSVKSGSRSCVHHEQRDGEKRRERGSIPHIRRRKREKEETETYEVDIGGSITNRFFYCFADLIEVTDRDQLK